MMLNPNYWRAIRECCPDDVAFERLQDILATRLVRAFRLPSNVDRETARYAAIAHAIPDLIFRIRRDGLYLDAEAIAEQDFAIPPEDMIGKSVYDLLPPDVAQQRMYYVAQALQTGKLQTFEYQLLNQGEVRDYEARVAVCSSQEVMLIARDITDRKRSEVQLQQALQEQSRLYQQVQQLNQDLERLVQERTLQLQKKMAELEEIGRQKDDFLHAVFHDLRTPLTGMMLVLRNLYTKTDAEMIAVPRSLIERMGDSGARQLHMMDSLLEAHFGEVRGVVLNCVAVDLASQVQAIAQDIEPLVQQNQAVLVNAIGATLPPVWADGYQLCRVFENLITNALKHNPPGVKLTLAAAVVAGDEVGDKAKDEASPAVVQIWVMDDGIGLMPEECLSLFDRYAQGRLDSKQQQQQRMRGIGLGLYLCRQIVTAHGGEIGVISAPGEGAKFWFTVPVAKLPQGNECRKAELTDQFLGRTG